MKALLLLLLLAGTASAQNIQARFGLMPEVSYNFDKKFPTYQLAGVVGSESGLMFGVSAGVTPIDSSVYETVRSGFATVSHFYSGTGIAAGFIAGYMNNDLTAGASAGVVSVQAYESQFRGRKALASSTLFDYGGMFGFRTASTLWVALHYSSVRGAGVGLLYMF